MAYKECFLSFILLMEEKKDNRREEKKEKNKTKHDNREKTCDC